MPPVKPTLRQVERLRELRRRSARDDSIGPLVARIRNESDRHHQRFGELVTLWCELVPADLVEQTALTGLRGGVLQVTVPSSAVAYRLDRALRGGLTSDLRSRFRGSLARVRVQVGEMEPLGPGPARPEGR